MPSNPETLFRKDHITLSIGAMLREPPSFFPAPGYTLSDPHPDIRWSRGFRLGFRHQINFGHRLGIQTGFSTTAFWTPIHYPGENGLQMAFHGDGRKQMIELPANAFIRIKLHPRVYLQPLAGFSLVSYQPRHTYNGTTVADSLLLEIRTDVGMTSWLYLHANLGLNTSILLGNQDMIVFGFSGHFNLKKMPTSIHSYTYFYPSGNTISIGTAFTRGNYFALDIGYTFTRTRELRRNLEGE